MKQKVTIATFNHRTEAEILERRLEEAGIPAEIEDESAIQRARLGALKPMAHMRVQVSEPDVDRAKKRTAELEAEGVVRGTVRCPDCGSSRVQYPQFTRNFLLPNLLATVLWRLRLVPAQFYCEECQFTWPAEAVTATPELDTLYWPKDSKKGPIGPQ